MELFKQTNFDFLRWKWHFIGASLVLSVAGLVSLAINGGPKLGIEFKGGMEMTAKFVGTPPVVEVRSSLSKALANPPSVETFENGSNEIAITTEGADDATLAKNKQIVIDTLAKTFGHPDNGKLDLNNTSIGQLADRLRDPFQKAGIQLSDPQIDQLAADIMGSRNKAGVGVLSSLDQVRSVPGVTPQIMNVLNEQTYVSPYTVGRDTQIVGPKVGADLRAQAINATLLALAGMLVYIWFRFEWIYGLAAVIAVFHDTIITIGIFSLFNREITLTVIAALLTLVGYSMNDTIVVFDRIRENLRLSRREPLDSLVNRSINQTLSRTVLTSGLTFLTVLSLYVFGGEVLRGFSFALVIGILIGTYSSIAIAAPMLVAYQDWRAQRGKAAALPAAKKARV